MPSIINLCKHALLSVLKITIVTLKTGGLFEPGCLRTPESIISASFGGSKLILILVSSGSKLVLMLVSGDTEADGAAKMKHYLICLVIVFLIHTCRDCHEKKPLYIGILLHLMRLVYLRHLMISFYFKQLEYLIRF